MLDINDLLDQHLNENEKQSVKNSLFSKNFLRKRIKTILSIPFSQIVSWQSAQSFSCQPVLLAILVIAEH